MGQEDILNFLTEHKGQKFETKQLNQILGLSYSGIHNNTKRLAKAGFINKLKVTGRHATHFWVDK